MRNNSQNHNISFLYPITPNNQRKPTDVGCLVIYSFLSLVALSSLFYSFILESDQHFWRPTDPDGVKCGIGQAQNFSYLYFTDPNPSQQSLKKTICVDQCPKQSINNEVNCITNSVVSSCKQDINLYATLNNKILHYCQPLSQKLKNNVQGLLDFSGISKFYMQTEKIIQVKFTICILCPVVCMMIMLFQLGLVYCCQNLKGLFFLNFIAFVIVLAYLGIKAVLLQDQSKFVGSSAIGIIMLVCSITTFIYVAFHHQNFMKSLQYINICSQFIFQNKRLIFLPLAMFGIWAISFTFALTVFIFILSIGFNVEQQSTQYYSPFQINKKNEIVVIILFTFTLLHYIWTCLIIHHLGKYVAIVGASNWILHAPRHFKNALFTLFKYHLGSVVKGSLLITLLSWITYLFYFLLPDDNNRLFCCYFPNFNRFYRSKFFQKYIGIYTDMTYLMMGLDGSNFEAAGQSITPYLVKSIRSLNQTSKLSKIIIKSCQLFVACLTTLICYQFLTYTISKFNNIPTILIIFIISMLLTSFGQDPYNKAYDTLLLTVIINKNKENKAKSVNNGSFPSAKSILSDGRVFMYQKIERWLQEQHNQQELLDNRKTY